MALYKNREVSVVGPNPTVHIPTTINIAHKDGVHENVPLSSVKFTDGEKKDLLKRYPSQFDAVEVINDEDLKSVRLGIAPASDPVVKEQAKEKLRHQAQVEAQKVQTDKINKDQEAELKKELNHPVSKPVSPVTHGTR